jgi:2-polyprenyl-6-methoxyphenol hydroxylase-like FAD-dependent oxidoreductase
MKQSIAIVGAGKVGTALAVLLQRSGYVVTGIASRSRDSAERPLSVSTRFRRQALFLRRSPLERRLFSSRHAMM